MLNQQLLSEWQKLKSLIIKQKQELQQLKSELNKEKNWWTKWMSDTRNNIWSSKLNPLTLTGKIYQQEGLATLTMGVYEVINQYGKPVIELRYHDSDFTKSKRMIKIIADYYKSQI